MAGEYLTIKGTGTGEYVEKKSRFLGLALHVESEEEAAAHLERIRKQYYDARHNCYAWIIGEQKEKIRSSDDGEPSGTAGQPILKVLEGSGCTNIMIIVTRYFGGTLLGTGGLVRAYTAASQDALDHAVTALVLPAKKVSVSCSYTDLARIEKLVRDDPSVYEGGRDYAENAELLLYLTAESLENFGTALGDASSGRAGFTLLGETGIVAAGDRFLREYGSEGEA